MDIFKYLSEKIATENPDLVGKSINYDELISLYNRYGGDLKLKDFYKMLAGDCRHQNFYNLKNGQCKLKVFKNRLLSPDELKDKIINENPGIIGKLLDYSTIISLFDKYGRGYSLRRFSEDVLEVQHANLVKLKNNKINARIIKSRILQLDEQLIRDLKNLIISENPDIVGRLLSRDQIQKLYQKYGQNIKFTDFIEKILDINLYTYRNSCRKNNYRTCVFKSELYMFSEEEIKEIKSKLIEDGYKGKWIDLETFECIYQMYGKNSQKSVFAKDILEINSNSFWGLITGRNSVKVLCSADKRSYIKRKYLSEPRYYTKEEIQSICKSEDIELDDFLDNIYVNKQRDVIVDEFKNQLFNKGSIWIGMIPCSDKFITLHYSLMKDVAGAAFDFNIKRMSLYSKDFDKEDMIEDAIVYIMTQRGDLEKKFADNVEILEKRLFSVIRKCIEIRIINILKIKELSLSDSTYENKDGDYLDIESTLASDINIPTDYMEKETKEEYRQKSLDYREIENIESRALTRLMGFIGDGMNPMMAIKVVSDEFGMNVVQMQRILQEYMLNSGNVKENSNGKIYSVKE